MYTTAIQDESELLHQLQEGDERAFAYIFERFYKRICLYAAHYARGGKEAEDLAEESFLRIWNGKRTFETMEHLKASLYQAVRHIGINDLVAFQRREAREISYMEEQEQTQEAALDQIVRSEVMGELYEAVNQLPPRARQIIVDTYLKGKTNQEVADEMGLSLQTVKNQKLRALALLRRNLSPAALFFFGVWYF